jgi:dihydrodipicolinate synthase/N-acetylneuraminate lyase
MSKELNSELKKILLKGVVIPAHPLALDENLRIDEKHQRLLTRYYIESGAGGIAIGVHTTQFEIRKPEFQLYEPVLRIAAEEIEKAKLKTPFIKIAGICGPADQAINEAELARKYGYDLGLLSMGGLSELTEDELLVRAKQIAEIIPLFGFYLQPAAGGRILSYEFWNEFARIPDLHAIKVAAFNRYQTLDVVRAVCNSPRKDEIALYTGNDDNIVADLLTSYRLQANGEKVEKRFVGGLLGHWSIWTSKAVELLKKIKHCIENNYTGIEELLIINTEVTDMNAAIFDAKNSFHGCVPGIHEILFRQGIMAGTGCLNPNEKLSPGQSEEIDRICQNYPYHMDDKLVANLLTRCKR